MEIDTRAAALGTVASHRSTGEQKGRRACQGVTPPPPPPPRAGLPGQRSPAPHRAPPAVAFAASAAPEIRRNSGWGVAATSAFGGRALARCGFRVALWERGKLARGLAVVHAGTACVRVARRWRGLGDGRVRRRSRWERRPRGRRVGVGGRVARFRPREGRRSARALARGPAAAAASSAEPPPHRTLRTTTTRRKTTRKVSEAASLLLVPTKKVLGNAGLLTFLNPKPSIITPYL